LHGGVILKNEDFRKESSGKGVWITPTSLQLEIILKVVDYGLKERIGTRDHMTDETPDWPGWLSVLGL
jgi:hypothetical protein